MQCYPAHEQPVTRGNCNSQGTSMNLVWVRGKHTSTWLQVVPNSPADARTARTGALLARRLHRWQVPRMRLRRLVSPARHIPELARFGSADRHYSV